MQKVLREGHSSEGMCRVALERETVKLEGPGGMLL